MKTFAEGPRGVVTHTVAFDAFLRARSNRLGDGTIPRMGAQDRSSRVRPRGLLSLAGAVSAW